MNENDLPQQPEKTEEQKPAPTIDESSLLKAQDEAVLQLKEALSGKR